MTRDWIEIKTDRMIQIAKRSQFAADIFRDARDFHAEGFTMDVAIAKSLRYWEGNPVTGHTPGVDS